MADRYPALQDNDTHLWAGVDDGDTIFPLELRGPAGLGGFVQMVKGSGFGGNVTMEKSNDGSTWVALADTDGVAISLSADGGAEFSTGARYIRPAPGASVADVNVYVRVNR